MLKLMDLKLNCRTCISILNKSILTNHSIFEFFAATLTASII